MNDNVPGNNPAPPPLPPPNEPRQRDASTGTLYLLRHGATANNLAHPPRVQGQRSNQSLSDDGRAQASAAARFLSSAPLAAVYTSPLLRARETAEIIAAAAKSSTQVVEELIECDVGMWEGRSWAEIQASEPESYRSFIGDPAMVPYRGGESLAQVFERTLPVLDALLEQSAGGSVAVVAHNIVNRVYLAHYLRVPLSFARGIRQDHCGLNVFRYEKGARTLVTVNSAFHLDCLAS